jgi:hypothetical protein
MGRGDVIEVPKANRPPDPMVAPKRPNVWTFHTACPSDQVGARLARGVGVEADLKGAEPIVGVFTPAGAVLRRRPTKRNNIKLPLQLNWTPEAEGAQVVCRMRLPIEYVLFIGVWLAFGLASLGAVPGAIMALILHEDRVAGFRRGSPVSHLVEPLVMIAVTYGLFRFVRAVMERDRAFLMDHATRALEAGPVRERREDPGFPPLPLRG